jgi:hypothetical protein
MLKRFEIISNGFRYYYFKRVEIYLQRNLFTNMTLIQYKIIIIISLRIF